MNTNLLSALYGEVWGIEESALATINGLLLAKIAGKDVDIAAAVGNHKPRLGPVRGDVAVLQLFGPIVHRANDIEVLFGGTSTEAFGRVFDAMVENPSIGAIILDVDSPGGTISGVPELSRKIFEARGKKPIIAVANAVAASAAFWIASSADQLVITPSGFIGSVGVWIMHQDLSSMAEKLGIKVTYISAGKFKVEGNFFEPLGDEARKHLQSRVDDIHDEFVGALSRNRSVSRSKVLKGFGEGRTFGAEQALAAGMVDKIETMGNVIARLVGRGRKGRPRAVAATMELSKLR